jgi:DNA-binding response OmpR family regulator
MKKAGLVRLREWPGEAPGHTPALLIAGPVEELDGPGSIFDRFSWPTRRARSCREVFIQVCASPPRVVVSERDLPDGSWKDVIEMVSSLPCPPPVIVTSRLADDYLWAEVLNLGGYDVLAKPLDAGELSRTLKLAWERWPGQRDRLQRANTASPNRGGSRVCLTA